MVNDECPSGHPVVVEALRAFGCRAVSCGDNSSFAVTQNDKVFAWGKTDGGNLGPGCAEVWCLSNFSPAF
jgi:alpha-tubulin suppressor-like RCC1 family protein